MNMKTLILTCAGLAISILSAQAGTLNSTGLLAYYKLDDSAGSLTGADSSGNGYDATVDAGNSSAPNTFGVPGKVGTAWHADSDGAPWASMKSDILRLPAGNNDELKTIGGGSYTLSGWYKPVDLPASGNSHLFSNSTAPGAVGVTISLLTGVHFPPGPPEETEMAHHQPGSQVFGLFPPPNFDDLIDTNFWYFWCVSFDVDGDPDPNTGAVSIYFMREDIAFLDGDSDVAVASVSAGNSDPRIGRFDAPGGFDAFWDEYTIWNRGLSDTEVEELFNLGVAGQEIPTGGPTTVPHTPVPAANAAKLGFQTQDGQNYRLQSTGDIVNGPWADTPYRILGDGSVISLFDDAGPDPGRTYRAVEP